MQVSDEKLCLQWNDFSENISSAFGRLREDFDFTDVTLACEDGQQIQAHIFALISSSPFFFGLLKDLKHPQPMIYMRGVKSVDLKAILDFVYCGETNVFQQDLDAFLALAEEFQLKGLTRNAGEKQTEKFSEKTYEPKLGQTATKQQHSNVYLPKPKPTTDVKFEENMTPSLETIMALPDFSETGTNIEELDLKLKSMMTFSENPAQGGCSGRARICNICGKEGTRTYVMQHIEANHMTGLSIPCNMCGNLFCSRNALRIHKSRAHRHGKNLTEGKDSETTN